MSFSPYLRALGIGVVAGMRSMTAPAATLLSGGHERAGLAALAAGGEALADKLPFIPPRVAPPVLGPRLLSGGWSGGVLAARGEGSRIGGIVFGVAGAAASTWLFYRLRQTLTQDWGWPDLPVALAEDVATVWLAWSVTANSA